MRTNFFRFVFWVAIYAAMMSWAHATNYSFSAQLNVTAPFTAGTCQWVIAYYNASTGAYQSEGTIGTGLTATTDFSGSMTFPQIAFVFAEQTTSGQPNYGVYQCVAWAVSVASGGQYSGTCVPAVSCATYNGAGNPATITGSGSMYNSAGAPVSSISGVSTATPVGYSTNVWTGSTYVPGLSITNSAAYEQTYTVTMGSGVTGQFSLEAGQSMPLTLSGATADTYTITSAPSLQFIPQGEGLTPIQNPVTVASGTLVPYYSGAPMPSGTPDQIQNSTPPANVTSGGSNVASVVAPPTVAAGGTAYSGGAGSGSVTEADFANAANSANSFAAAVKSQLVNNGNTEHADLQNIVNAVNMGNQQGEGDGGPASVSTGSLTPAGLPALVAATPGNIAQIGSDLAALASCLVPVGSGGSTSLNFTFTMGANSIYFDIDSYTNPFRLGIYAVQLMLLAYYFVNEVQRVVRSIFVDGDG